MLHRSVFRMPYEPRGHADAFYACSYLCKVQTRVFELGFHRFGCFGCFGARQSQRSKGRKETFRKPLAVGFSAFSR